jgi:hypothetical protein
MEEVLTFPSCFFFRLVAPLYHEELDCFTPRDTIISIKDNDWVLRGMTSQPRAVSLQAT